MVGPTYVIALTNGAASAATTPAVLQPPVIAALVAGLVAIVTIAIGTWANHRLQQGRLGFDKDLAKQRFDFDMLLAERKFRLEVATLDWKRKTDFAQIALASFYEARAKIAEVRSPMASSSENDDRAGRDQEQEDVRRVRDIYYPIVRRLTRHADFFNEMYARRYAATALFGVEADVPFRGIWSALTQIQSAAFALMRTNPRDNRQAQEFRDRMEGRIWEGATEDDPVLREVAEAVELAEHLFRPVLVGSAPGANELAADPAEQIAPA